MGLFDRFKKSKWQHEDAKIRIEGIDELNDQEILENIARNEPDSDVRKKAICKITNESVLVDIIKNESSKMVCESGFEKINNDESLADIAKNASYWPIRCRAIEMIDDEETLKYIAKNDLEMFVRSDAIKKINDKDFLNKIVDSGSDDEKLSALSKLADMNELGNNLFVLFNLSNSATIQIKDEANNIMKKINNNEIARESDIKIQKGIKISLDDFTIDGNGYSIIGDGDNQWIDISGKNIILKNITFKDFSNYNHGGVIRNTSNSLTIENCNFINNHVEKCSNGDSERFGGVIDNGGRLKVINSNFNKNKADSGGVSTRKMVFPN